VVDVNHVVDESINNDLLIDLSGADLDDFYTVGLWNYCSGAIIDGKDVVEYCSSFKTLFWLNIKDIWADTGKIQEHFPKEVESGFRIYEKVSKWVTAAFFAGTLSIAAQFLIGVFLSFCCTLGICGIGTVAVISTFFVITLSVTVSIFFGALSNIMNKYLDGYGIHCNMGRNIYILLWMAALFSGSAMMFWIFDVCCGFFGKNKKSHREKGRGTHIYKSVGFLEDVEHSGLKAFKMEPSVIVVPIKTNTAYEPYSVR